MKEPATLVGRDYHGAQNPAQLGPRGHFRGMHTFDPVAHGALDVANVAYQAHEAADFDRRRLIATPHGPVKGNVAFDKRCTQGNRRPGWGQTGLVARIADVALGIARAERLNHA